MDHAMDFPQAQAAQELQDNVAVVAGVPQALIGGPNVPGNILGDLEVPLRRGVDIEALEVADHDTDEG